MPNGDPSTATSAFFPDVAAADPNEEQQASKRAASLGLLSAGLAILSQPHYKHESQVVPIARGLSVGLDEYRNSMSDAAKAMMEKRKEAVDAWKENIAEKKADAYEQRQIELEQESNRKMDIQQSTEAERVRHDTATEQSTETYRDIQDRREQEQARHNLAAEGEASRRASQTDTRLEMMQREQTPVGVDFLADLRNNPKVPQSVRDNINTMYPDTVTPTYLPGQSRQVRAKYAQYTEEALKPPKAGAAGKEIKGEANVNGVPFNVTYDPTGKPLRVDYKTGTEAQALYKSGWMGGTVPLPSLDKIAPLAGSAAATPTRSPVGTIVRPTAGKYAGKTLEVTASGYREVTGGEAAARGSAGTSGAGPAPGAPAAPGGIAPAPEVQLQKKDGVPYRNAKGEYWFVGKDGRNYVSKNIDGTGAVPLNAGG